MPTPQQLAQQFLEYFNDRNHAGLLELVDSDMRYNGRHGHGEGIHLLQEWIERATTSFSPRRWFGNDDLAVVEVDVEWRSPHSGEVTDHVVWAIAFAIEGGRITSVSRYADVGEAVTKMGLHEVDSLLDDSSVEKSAT